jgi:predicted MFS family arabinose efflux permease
VIAAAALILVGTLESAIPAYLGALLVGVFIFGHSFGPGSQGKTMAALSYPTQFRGVGTGWAEAMSRVGSILGFYVFPLVLAVAGLAHTLLYLTAIPLLALLALLSIRWEPVGQDVENDNEAILGGGPTTGVAAAAPAPRIS